MDGAINVGLHVERTMGQAKVRQASQRAPSSAVRIGRYAPPLTVGLFRKDTPAGPNRFGPNSLILSN